MSLKRAIAALALILVACSTASPPPTPSPTPLPPEAAAAVDAATQAAVTHLGVSPDQLQVRQVQAQQWPDSSLGCPEPGQQYSQIVTPGFLVMITSGPHELEYHTDMRSRVVLCRES